MTGRGSHALNPYKVSPEFETDKRRRQGTLSAKNFDELKEVFGNQCATCGAKEGETNPRYGDDIVELQRGHKDPDKPMTLDNIIPQCQFCNRAYRRDYVFDDKGRVFSHCRCQTRKKGFKDSSTKGLGVVKKQGFHLCFKAS